MIGEPGPDNSKNEKEQPDDRVMDGNKAEPHDQTKSSPLGNDCWQCGFCIPPKIRSFFCWLNPDNLPHYLIAAFTLGLAIFACNAWLEAQKGTQALQGQLKVMLEDRQPYIGPTENLGAPNLHLSNIGTGQVTWQFAFENYGKSLARNIRFRMYVKIGKNDVYRASYGPAISVGSDMPPSATAIAAAISAPDPTLTQDRYDQLVAADEAIGVLVEFEYSDLDGTKFVNTFCMERLASGAISLPQPEKCQKEKAI